MKSTNLSFFRHLITSLLFVCLVFGGSVIGDGMAASTEARTDSSILYVTPDASENGSCSAWTDPCDLQDALAAATQGNEIWVKAGVYYPGPDTAPVTVTFQIKTGVSLYGGFAGVETTREQRGWLENPTILSGDIDRNGVLDSGNAYHVVTGSGVDATAVLDGFTITAGNADGEISDSRGGGIYIFVGSPTLTNVTFSSNNATEEGGGMIIMGGSPALNEVTFFANSADYGGGLYNQLGTTIMTNVTFFNNSASDGGGIYNDHSSPTLNNVIFFNNIASWGGGGLYNDEGAPVMTNVTFFNNSASVGGALDVTHGSPKLANVTLYGNNATINGGGLYILTASPTLTNTILWGNTPDQINGSATVTYSDVQGGYTGEGNLDIDPLFVDAVNHNLRLQPGSPVIDTGNNAAVPPEVTTDLDGSPRIVDYPPSDSPIVDMGAYEAQVGGGIIYVDRSAPGPVHDGTSWTTAFLRLQTGLATATEGSEIWVADGTYYPGPRGDRLATFLLKSGVAVYGGFIGFETAREQRDWLENRTILSGGIDQNVGLDNGNAYHVVTGSGSDPTAVLDGFTITAGYANGLNPHSYGGGMYNFHGSPTLSNLTFFANLALSRGGGMYNYSSDPNLTSITFSDNSTSNVDGEGGGLCNYGGHPALTSVTFSGNSALGDNARGGGMFNQISTPILTNVTFSANLAGMGGGMYNYGSSPTVNYGTFTANSAGNGGGVYNIYASNPKLTGVILWGNTPDQIFNIYTGTATVTYSDIQGGYTGEGNIDADPLLDVLAYNGGSTQTQALLTGSPAIDAGSPNCPPPATDQRGVNRPIDGDGDGEAVCDMGSYEYQLPSITTINSDNPDPSLVGQTFTVTVSVTSTLGIPTGTVTITVSTSPVTCNISLVDGLGSCAVKLSIPGNYTLTATYSGDDVFTPSSDTDLHIVRVGIFLPVISKH